MSADTDVAGRAVARLHDERLTLAAAESLTGGLVGARITDVPGASAVFLGSMVTYASEAKFALLGVPRGPVVSAACAEAMALGARERFDADVGVSTTGVAGPDEQEGQSVGTVFVGLATAQGVESHELALAGDRRAIREATTQAVFELLLTYLDAVPRGHA